jgi:hypothetical protein
MQNDWYPTPAKALDPRSQLTKSTLGASPDVQTLEKF